MNRLPRTLAALAVLALTASCAQMQTAMHPVDAHLPSNAQTVVWGHIPAERKPVLTIKSGQTVRIDTVSHHGVVQPEGPVKFFARAGIPPNEVLPDAIEIFEKVKRPKGASVHVLTGPIYVDGAEPGDMLEVRMIDMHFRVPYGVNNSNKGSGVLPDLLSAVHTKIIKFDLQRRVALFAPGIEVPLVPFMGTMAVAPASGSVPDVRAPGLFGGNMDLNRLTTGSSVYLPVYQRGALFYTGDSHAVQADGEVNGTAIEASLTPTLQFIVHKGVGKTMKWPRAEDKDNYYVMGLDVNLDVAMREAVQETVTFLGRERGLSPGDAYSLASIGVNYIVAEAVDHVQLIYGAIPKKLFSTNKPFWYQR